MMILSKKRKMRLSGKICERSVLSMSELEKQLNKLVKEYSEKHGVSLATAKSTILEASKKILHESKE